MWFSAERSAEEAITSPRVTLRRKSVISSGRSSIRSTITCTSGSLTSTAWAMRFRSVVLPAFGGATIRQRWPRPMGASRSTTRPHISSGSVSSFMREFGSIEMSSLNAERWRKAPGSRPSTISIRRTTGRLPSTANAVT